MHTVIDLFSTKIAYASLDSFIGSVETKIVNPLILFLFALAIVFFLYGVLEFFMNQDSDEKKTTGKSHMFWGVIGITIMLSVWTILGIVLNTMGVTGINPQQGTVQLQ